MNKKDKEIMKKLIKDMAYGNPYHSKITMAQELIKFLDNVDRGRRKTSHNDKYENK